MANVPKKTIIGAAIFACLNIAWAYVFSRLNLGLMDLFDYGIYMRFADLSLVFLLLGLGLLMAAAIAAMVYASGENKKTELIFFGTGGGASAVAAFALFQSAFAGLLMAFFAAGCVLFIYGRPKEPEGIFSKLKFGWAATRKIATIFAIGAFLTGVLFGMANKAACEQTAKDSIIGVALKSVGGGMGLQNILSKDDVKNMLCGSVTRNSIETLAKAQLGSTWDQLTKAAQDDMVDNMYNQSLNTCNDESYINQAYASIQEKLGTGFGASQPMIERFLTEMPIMKTMMQFLPLLAGFVLFSVVNMFMTIFVAPFSALFALGMKTKEKEGMKEGEAKK